MKYPWKHMTTLLSTILWIAGSLVNPATALSFEEARDIILEKLTDETAKNLAYDAAEAVSEIRAGG